MTMSQSDALRAECEAALAHPNVRAFLRLVRVGESCQDESAYRWLFGSTVEHPLLFTSFANHPHQVVRTKWGWTSAAGAYQLLAMVPGFTKFDTWGEARAALALPDFGPHSQDLAAVWCIRRRDAIGDLFAGRVAQGIVKCRPEWASLPGATSGQPTVALAHALEVYAQYGGTTADGVHPAVVVLAAPPPLLMPPIAAAPFQPAAATKEPTPMLPQFAWGLASAVIDLFTPLAREKLAKEVGRHTDSPEVAGNLADGIIGMARTLTGKDDPIDAIAAARADVAMLKQIEDHVLDELERMAPLLDKLAGWDKDAWAAEEGSRDSAAARAALLMRGEPPFLRFGAWLNVSFLEFLSLLLVATSIAGAVSLAALKLLDGQLLGAIVTLMLIAGYTGVREFWLGSSRASAAKDLVIGELSRRTRG